MRPGARVDVVPGKRNPSDFALWKLTPEGELRQMEWDSPWGRGFPGWHTECVVMSIETLGIPFDIHCGGIDHIPVHHTNEIAQAEAAYGKQMARFWMHGEFINLGGEKMSKSEGNIITIKALKDEGFSALDYRYLCLGAHYKSKMNFSFDALSGAKAGLRSLKEKAISLRCDIGKKPKNIFMDEFLESINDDLDTPRALAITWKMMRSKMSTEEKYATLLRFDEVFGLRLGEVEIEKIPYKVKEMVQKREQQRKDKLFDDADKTRAEIEEMGYYVEDTPKGVKIKKI